VAERLLEVGERREHPLARPVGGVYQAIKDLKPVVAHAEAVRVGEREADRPPDGPVILDDAVQLPPDVLGGGVDVGQDPGNDELFESAVQHRTDLSGCRRAARARKLARKGGGLSRSDRTRGLQGPYLARKPVSYTRGSVANRRGS